MTATILHGDCLELMREMEAESVTAICTDPPYGIGFMGREWDTFSAQRARARVNPNRGRDCDNPNVRGRVRSPAASPAAIEYDRSPSGQRGFQAWTEAWAREALRVAKPGAFLLCFAGTRTFHRVACGIEDAGWEVRDTLCWLFGQGFPKSHDISKAIDKAAGAVRSRKQPQRLRRPSIAIRLGGYNVDGFAPQVDEPITEQARLWSGYGTALKPCWEPIIVAMKPLDGTFAGNALKHGVAGINVDGCRIGTGTDRSSGGLAKRESAFQAGHQAARPAGGRWPPNVALDEAAAAALGDVSRYFYCPKASKAERERGLEGLPLKHGVGTMQGDADGTLLTGSGNPRDTTARNSHPTVKPLALMRWLVRLVTMPEGTVILDPFAGSGTTLVAAVEEGVSAVGIELEAESVEIARRRIRYAQVQKAIRRAAAVEAAIEKAVSV